jgi:hypothetical protein
LPRPDSSRATGACALPTVAASYCPMELPEAEVSPERSGVDDGRHRLVACGRSVPNKFYGGIVGAFVAATAGALLTGYALPEPGVPTENPPGVKQVLWAVPGSVLALAGSYVYGARHPPGEY